MSRRTELDVWLHGRPIGVLTAMASDTMRFEYVADDAPVLSLSLRERRQEGPHVRHWFANLLPEGEARVLAAQQHGIGVADDFGLLAALGRECAGAVALLPRGEAPPAADEAVEFEPLALDRIDAWIAAPRRGRLGGEAPMRLSLAGAQFKAAVLRFDDGTLALPLNGAPSSHILKIPDRDLPDIVTLEALGMRLAAATGLRVAPVELLPTATPSLLVARYDRRSLGNGRYARIHQEDFCQALGIAPEQKYEERGGPGLATVFAHLRRWGADPARLPRLLDWTVFNAILGNADAHAKNISLLHGEDGTIGLAPAYDLVPSGMIAGIDRGLAMRIGAATTIDAVTAADWEALADEIGISKTMVARTRTQLAARVADGIDSVCDRLADEGAQSDVLERAAATIGLRARAVAAGEPLPGEATARNAPGEPWQR